MKLTLGNINNILNKKIGKLCYNSVNYSFYRKNRRSPSIDEFIIEYKNKQKEDKVNELKLINEFKNSKYKPYNDNSRQYLIPN